MKIIQLRAELLFLLGCWHPDGAGGVIEAFLRFEMASQKSLLLESVRFAGSTTSRVLATASKRQHRN